MKKLPNNISNFEILKKEDYYFIDKTKYIEILENTHEKQFLFLSPHGYGKSVFLDMLDKYYDLKQKDNFDILFDNTYIHSNPTSQKNSFLTLNIDFGKIDISTPKNLYDSFAMKIRDRLVDFVERYPEAYFEPDFVKLAIRNTTIITSMMSMALMRMKKEYKVILLIDNYDEFLDSIIFQKKITKEDGTEGYEFDFIQGCEFIKSFYSEIKRLHLSIIEKIFIFGELPVCAEDRILDFKVIESSFKLSAEYPHIFGLNSEDVSNLMNEYVPENNKDCIDHIKSLYSMDISETDKIFNTELVLSALENHLEGCHHEKLVTPKIKRSVEKIKQIFYFNQDTNLELLKNIFKNSRVSGSLNTNIALDDIQKSEILFSFLFYTGFLGYKANEFFIPNELGKELTKEFSTNLLL